MSEHAYSIELTQSYHVNTLLEVLVAVFNETRVPMRLPARIRRGSRLVVLVSIPCTRLPNLP